MVRVLHVDYDVVDYAELADGVVYDHAVGSSARSSYGCRRTLESVDSAACSSSLPPSHSFQGGRTLSPRKARSS